MAGSDYFALKHVQLGRSGEWSCSVHRFVFVFPNEGTGLCVSGSDSKPLKPGDVMVSNQRFTPKLRLRQGSQFSFRYFSLAAESLLPLLVGHEISLLQKLTDRPAGIRVYPAKTSVATHCHRLVDETPSTSNPEHRGQLLRIAGLILTEEFGTLQRERQGTIRLDQDVVKVFEKLSTDELLQCSVPELADRFGCSRRHLNRLFHQYFNSSVGAVRKELRLLKSLTLLRDRQTKIINVAEECGFNHLGLFNASFKIRFGVTPGQWRKRLDQAPAPAVDGPQPHGNHCFLMARGLCPMAVDGELRTNQRANLQQLSSDSRSAAQSESPSLRVNREPGNLRLQIQIAAWASQPAKPRLSI